jgi:hypothetical protein
LLLILLPEKFVDALCQSEEFFVVAAEHDSRSAR